MSRLTILETFLLWRESGKPFDEVPPEVLDIFVVANRAMCSTRETYKDAVPIPTYVKFISTIQQFKKETENV